MHTGTVTRFLCLPEVVRRSQRVPYLFLAGLVQLQGGSCGWEALRRLSALVHKGSRRGRGRNCLSDTRREVTVSARRSHQHVGSSF